MTDSPYHIIIPQETVNDESVRIISWKVASGAIVVKDQLICEIETSKVVMEMHAPVGGVLDYTFSVGDEVAIGTALCSIIPESAATAHAASNGTSNHNHRNPVPYLQGSATAPFPVTDDRRPVTADLPPARMTPSARRVAAEHRIEISAFPVGSLIRKNDVLRMAGLEVDDGAFAPPTPRQKRQSLERSSPPARSVPAVGVPVEWQSLARRKVIEGKILEAGKATTVQSSVTTRVKAPLLRARVRELHQSEVAFDALIIFEASRLLLQYPELNAIHDTGRIGQYRQVNMCWAIDGGRNLVAPVVKHSDRKSLGEIVAVMERQLEAYLDNSLGVEELTGGTFTVSDLSTDGVCFFNPLISQGQAAILGIGSDWTANGEESLYLTLAFDHQLAEGRTAARFLKDLALRLEAHSAVQWLKAPPAMETAKSPSDGGAYCVVCQRDYSQLQRSRAVLLKSEIPRGLVCSLCVGGF